MENWKKIIIDGVETYYSVSDYGNVRNDSTRTLLKGSISNNGYKMVHLRQRIDKNCSVHRLVMKAFCPCENMDILQINHKDGNKLNNNIDNLEWCTALHNIRHSFEKGLQKNKMLPCYVYDLDGNYLMEFTNAVEAGKSLKIHQSTINRCLNEELCHCNQYQFKIYKKDKIPKWNNPKRKPVYVYDTEGNFLKKYESQSEAAEAFQVVKSAITKHKNNGTPLNGMIISNTPL